MFTGIVQAVGAIEALTPLQGEMQGGVRLAVEAGGLELSEIRVGDSICVQGACLTVVAIEGRRLSFDVSRETLDCTTGLAHPGKVNLETSLGLGDKLGGHLVTGHVDGVGRVREMRWLGESAEIVVEPPRELDRYLVEKGSVAVDGISLTAYGIRDGAFSVALIPYTLEVTNLREARAGNLVNLEADVIAKYVERLLEARGLPG